MKALKRVSGLTVLLCIMASFSQCSSAQKLQEKAPTKFGEVYCESWVAGVQGGGSGINIFIPVSDTSIKLDSVYFRGQAEKLSTKPQNKQLFIGYFKTEANTQKGDIIMSGNPNEEVGNQMPKLPKKIPFELKDSECVITYKEGETTKYYKIENVVEKQAIAYPSARPNGNR